MSPRKYLFAVALPLLMLGLLTRPLLSAQQPGAIVEIRGRVLYTNGEVAREALVFAFKDGRLTGRIPTGNSDNEGRFVIKRLESGAQYDLCASKPDGGYLNPFTLPFGLSTGGQCKKITASAALEVDVVLAPKGGTIEGAVRDERSQNAISNGKVVIYRPLKLLRGTWMLVNPREATWVPSAEGTVDAKGQFKISGLPAGRYFLKAEIHGRKIWYFNNQASDTAAQPIFIQGGVTRKIVVSVP